MATKEDKRQARGVIEGLEHRVHAGPPIRETEIQSLRHFLRLRDFSPASDYHNRLLQIQNRLQMRAAEPFLLHGKRDYAGKAAGRHMQLQSVFDHVILSTCYEGDFNTRHGRIKLSHRFNQEGRIDFVELKFLRSLHPCLNGAIRKLLLIADYQSFRKDWDKAEAFVLETLPRELIFLYPDIFKCPRAELLAWLVNIGHRIVGDLLAKGEGEAPEDPLPWRRGANQDQLCLQAVRHDEVAWPILEKAASLETTVEAADAKSVVVFYSRK